MQTIYQLKHNKTFIDQVRAATQTTMEFGIEPTHGLFGGTEWWANIHDGTIRTHCLSGTIERVYMGSMGDWPMITVRSSSGEMSNWTRECQTPELDRFYIVGARIEIDYVVQQSRLAGWSAGADQKNVLGIRVEEETHIQIGST